MLLRRCSLAPRDDKARPADSELRLLFNTARSGALHDTARDAVVPKVADGRPRCQGAIRVHRARKLEI